MTQAIFFGLFAFATAASAFGGVLKTRDGRTFEGDISIDDGRFVIRRSGGDEQRIDIDAISSVILRPPGAPATPAPAQPAAMDRKKPRTLQGLRGEYFADRELKDLKLVRVDPRVEFHWPGERSPDPLVPREFSVRWTGQVEAPHTDDYLFYVDASAGARLWVDGKLVIDRWQSAPGSFSGPATLRAGQRYDLRLEYANPPFGGPVRLAWYCRKQDYQVIPPERLFPPAGTVPPAVELVAPKDGALFISPARVPLEAIAADADGTVRQVRFFAGDRQLGEAARAPWRMTLEKPPAGYHALKTLATDNARIVSPAHLIGVAIADDAGGTFPAPWAQMPVGTRDSLGSVRYADGAFAITCRGGDLWGERDVFHYLFQPLECDGRITARLTSFTPGDPGGVAGLLLRETLAPGHVKQAFLGVAPELGLVFVRRVNEWEKRRRTEEAAPRLPCWLRLTRQGRQVKAECSADGKSWQMLGTREVRMEKSVIYAGLAIAAPSANARAVFDAVDLQPGSPPLALAERGVVLRGGSVVASPITSYDDGFVRLSRHADRRVPLTQLAIIAFRPLKQEDLDRLPRGRGGLLLASGDFVEGEVRSIRDGSVRVDSVVLGVRRFSLHNQAAAAILREVSPMPGRYEVRTLDGSVYRVQGLEIARKRLLVHDVCGSTFALPPEQLVQIRAIALP